MELKPFIADSSVSTRAFFRRHSLGWTSRRRGPNERTKWLGLVRTFLDITLGLIPRDQQILGGSETEDHPDEFDAWVYGVVAATIPSLTATEDDRTLWQPILDRGPPAHKWIERFFWEWFTVGVRAAQTPERFTAIWSAMIKHTLQSPVSKYASGRIL